MTRKMNVKIFLETRLKFLLHSAKNGYTSCALSDIEQIKGMLQYARLTGDINYETSDRITKLLYNIADKYNIY